MNEDKRHNDIIFELRNRVRQKPQPCYNPGCMSMTNMRSHVLQQNGVLNLISENGKIYLLGYNHLNSDSIVRFYECGINENNDLLKFWAFCNKCDNAIFREIEQDVSSINFDSYKVQLLFSYRGLLSELYKQERNILHYQLIFDNTTIPDQKKMRFRGLNQIFELSVEAIRECKREIERDLILGANSFKFITIRLPKLEIAASTVFSQTLLPIMRNYNGTILNRNNIRASIKLECVFFNLIPTQDQTMCIFGLPMSMPTLFMNPFERVSEMRENIILKIISDLMVMQIESWFMSPNYYRKLKAQGADELVISFKHFYHNRSNRGIFPLFNLFDNVLK